MAGDIATARQQLELALKFSDCDDPETLALLAETYEAQAAALSHEKPGWDRQMLSLLQKSLELSPQRTEGYARRGLKPLLVRPDPVGAEAHELLLTALARGVKPGWLHGLLAEWCSRVGRKEECLMHWRAVVAAMPDSAVALQQPGERIVLERLAAAGGGPGAGESQALAIRPDIAAFRETRAREQILGGGMGRSREALADLLAVVRAFRRQREAPARHAGRGVSRLGNAGRVAVASAVPAVELEPDTVFEPAHIAPAGTTLESRRGP